MFCRRRADQLISTRSRNPQPMSTSHKRKTVRPEDATAICIVMQKNERELLPLWISYHGSLFGYRNLYIYDNGSDADVVDYLIRAHKGYGINVDFSHSEPDHFELKGNIIENCISHLTQVRKADFYFPLDCDEFIGVVVNDAYSCTPSDINDELSVLRQKSRHCAFTVRAFADNCPWDEDTYFIMQHAPKLFFSNTCVEGLDLGFHACHKPNVHWTSNIMYFHMHFKPYGLLTRYAREKLKARLPMEKTQDAVLLAYTGSGYHLIRYLTQSEEDIHKWLDSHPRIFTTAFASRLAELELGYPYRESIKKLRSARFRSTTRP